MDETTDCVQLVDAVNAFKSLNRSAALQNVGFLCPPVLNALRIFMYPLQRWFSIKQKKLWSQQKKSSSFDGATYLVQK